MPTLVTESDTPFRGSLVPAALPAAAPAAGQEFQFWAGASGKRYVHTIFDLVGCPRIPACSYVLVRREVNGRRTAVRIATASAEAWSLNLAEIRHRAAQLGANEVHVHLIALSGQATAGIAADLQAAHFAELAPEPSEVPHRLI